MLILQKNEKVYVKEIRTLTPAVLWLRSEWDKAFILRSGDIGSRYVSVTAHNRESEILLPLYADCRKSDNYLCSVPLAVALLKFSNLQTIDHIVVIESEEFSFDYGTLEEYNNSDTRNEAYMYIGCENLAAMLQEEIEYAKKLTQASLNHC